MSEVIWGNRDISDDKGGVDLSKLTPLQRTIWALAESTGQDMDVHEALFHSPECKCAKCAKFHALFNEED